MKVETFPMGIMELLLLASVILIPIIVGLLIVGIALFSSRRFNSRSKQVRCPACNQMTHVDAPACPECRCELR